MNPKVLQNQFYISFIENMLNRELFESNTLLKIFKKNLVLSNIIQNFLTLHAEKTITCVVVVYEDVKCLGQYWSIHSN